MQWSVLTLDKYNVIWLNKGGEDSVFLSIINMNIIIWWQYIDNGTYVKKKWWCIWPWSFILHLSLHA